MSCPPHRDLSGGILVDLEPAIVLVVVDLGSCQGHVELQFCHSTEDRPAELLHFQSRSPDVSP